MNTHTRTNPHILGWTLLLLTMMFATATFAATGAPVGKVLMTVGIVSATSTDTNRILERRSDIYVGDVIHTGTQSQLQIRMTDGALITVAPEAEFAIKTYRFSEAGKKDEAVLSLVKGGLRTITGHLEKSGYKLETPVASLGIRGTIYEVYVAADGATTVILREGGVDVSDQFGDTLKLDVAGLATVIKPGSAPTTPGDIPDDVLNYFNSILPVPLSGGTWESYQGGTIFTFDFDPEDILTDPPTGFPPPGLGPDGELPFGPPAYINPCIANPYLCDG